MDVWTAQADEDDEGHEGLQNLEKAWDCGQKSTNLIRFSPGQPNLSGIQDEGQKGNDTGTNLSAAGRASEEVGIDDGWCKHLHDRIAKDKCEKKIFGSFSSN